MLMIDFHENETSEDLIQPSNPCKSVATLILIFYLRFILKQKVFFKAYFFVIVTLLYFTTSQLPSKAWHHLKFMDSNRNKKKTKNSRHRDN